MLQDFGCDAYNVVIPAGKYVLKPSIGSLIIDDSFNQRKELAKKIDCYANFRHNDDTNVDQRNMFLINFLDQDIR